MWVPASLATGLPGCHSGLLFPLPPQASVPASPAVQAESLAPTYWDKCTSNGGHCQVVWPGKTGLLKSLFLLGKGLPLLSTTFETVGAIPPYTCGCAAKSPFVHVCVCLACAPAHAKHTQTCTPTFGRLRRPTCTRILPLQFEKPCWTNVPMLNTCIYGTDIL